jgi:2-oxoglutarate ferredoxin oxidoreductase subunit alpha
MMDLDLGMNNWMSDGFKYPDKDQSRQAVDRREAQGDRRVGPLRTDGDGIAYRTIPGDGLPVYFTRGSGHNAKGQYSERPDDYVENMDRLTQVRDRASVRPEASGPEQPEGEDWLPRYGTSHFAIEESRDQLRDETKVETSYFRLRARIRSTSELSAFIDAQ